VHITPGITTPRQPFGQATASVLTIFISSIGISYLLERARTAAAWAGVVGIGVDAVVGAGYGTGWVGVTGVEAGGVEPPGVAVWTHAVNKLISINRRNIDFLFIFITFYHLLSKTKTIIFLFQQSGY
jgi:hypothetical protein